MLVQQIGARGQLPAQSIHLTDSHGDRALDKDILRPSGFGELVAEDCSVQTSN
jgi:hypothetical protein